MLVNPEGFREKKLCLNLNRKRKWLSLMKAFLSFPARVENRWHIMETVLEKKYRKAGVHLRVVIKQFSEAQTVLKKFLVWPIELFPLIPFLFPRPFPVAATATATACRCAFSSVKPPARLQLAFSFARQSANSNVDRQEFRFRLVINLQQKYVLSFLNSCLFLQLALVWCLCEKISKTSRSWFWHRSYSEVRYSIK